MKKEERFELNTENGKRRIKYFPPATPAKFTDFIPVIIIFALWGFGFLMTGKPWEAEKRQAEAKIRAERREQFRSEKLNAFFSDCLIEYSDDYLEGHEIDFEKFALIIKNAENEAENPYRSRIFGHIYFIGNKDNEFVVGLTFFGYGKGGYVNVSICEGDPATSDYYGRYYSKELLEWSKETFPEVFEEIKEYQSKPSFGWLYSIFIILFYFGFLYTLTHIGDYIRRQNKIRKLFAQIFDKTKK